MASKFATAFKRQAEKHFEAAKDAEPGSGNRVKLPEGEYNAKLVYEGEMISTGKLKGTPKIVATATVMDGEYVGMSESKGMIFPEGGEYTEDAMKKLVKFLKATYPEEADDISQLDHDGITEYVEGKFSEPINVCIAVETGEIDGKPNKWWSVVGPLADAPVKATKSKAKPKPKKEEPEEEEEVDEEEPGDYEPSKGDIVKHKPAGKRVAREFTIRTVNKAKGTVTLEDEDGETIAGVPFDKIEPVTE